MSVLRRLLVVLLVTTGVPVVTTIVSSAGVASAAGSPNAPAKSSSTAKNALAQQNLQKALTGAKNFYTQNLTYSGLDPTTFRQVAPDVTAIPGNLPATKPGEISFLVPSSGRVVILAAWGASRDCWAIIDITDANTVIEGFSGAGTLFLLLPHATKSTCSANTFNSRTKVNGVLVEFIWPVKLKPLLGGAVPNLKTAETAALTYWTANNATFSGLDPTNFDYYGGGALTAVAGNTPSAKQDEISLLVSSDGNIVLFAAWGGSSTCYALIINVDFSVIQGIMGQSTVHISLPNVKSTVCSALTFDTVSATSGATVGPGTFP